MQSSSGNVVEKKNPTNNFSKNILKSIVGPERAQNAFNSISMNVIPSQSAEKSISLEVLQKAKSLNQIGNVMNSRLEELKIKIDKKGDKPKGIDAYITEDASDSGNDSFEEFTDDYQASLQDKELDVSKLIDLELIKLLKYCSQLSECREQDSYQEDIMFKAIELGKKTHDKLLIFDMDETLIAAKFEGKVPAKFEKTFSYMLHGTEISVRLRPYVMDCLEKLATMYEIIVFTAGQQDYADHILDYIDPNKKIFKRRLYR